MRVLNLGSLNIDRTYKVNHFVMPKETIKALGYQEFCGGKGLNQSVALSRAGAEVYHAGCVGGDGDFLLNLLKEKKVNTDCIRRSESPSGHAIIQVDEEGQNNIIICGGANDDVTREYIDEVLGKFEKGDLLLLQNEVSNIDYAIERASGRGMVVAFNPSPVNEMIEACDLRRVNYFILNEVEGKYLAKADSDEPGVIMEKLQERFPDAGFVLTLGENGAYYFDKEKKIHQEVYKTKAVDTTGAGDTFTGYFLAGIAAGRKTEDAMELAGIAAGISVSRHGVAVSIPDIKEVNAVRDKISEKKG